MQPGEYYELYAKNRPLILVANQVVAREIREGRLKPASESGPCWDCGRPATCWDHRDYEKPLEVEPVCGSCNRRRGAAPPYLEADSCTENRQRPFAYPHVLRAFREGDQAGVAINLAENPKIRRRK